MREARTAGLERELKSLEAEFRYKLVIALRRCASGYWGLFGQRDLVEPELSRRFRPPELDELLSSGQAIEDIRDNLCVPDVFPLFERLKRMRAMKGANVLGEPRLAREWLAELGASDH